MKPRFLELVFGCQLPIMPHLSSPLYCEILLELEWLGDGPRQVASAIVDLALTEQDQQDIRWYVEKYAEYPFDPYPARAARVEARMRELGHELFRKLFGANTVPSRCG